MEDVLYFTVGVLYLKNCHTVPHHRDERITIPLHNSSYTTYATFTKP